MYSIISDYVAVSHSMGQQLTYRLSDLFIYKTKHFFSLDRNTCDLIEEKH